MKCPNCGDVYEPNTKFCSKCGHPLGNADYRPLPDRDYKKKKKGRLVPKIIALAAVIIIAAAAGYHAYIEYVKAHCRQAVETVFEAAHDMNFSSIDPAYLPEELRDDPDIRSLLKKKLSEITEENATANTLADYISEAVDIDMICDDIVSSADYEIVSVRADYKSCRVTVRTSNTDYSKVTDSLYQELYTKLTDTGGIWESIGSFFSSIFGGNESSGQQIDLADLIRELYQEAKSNTAPVSTTGAFEFGIDKGSWTLKKFDRKLLYSYYGISGFIDDTQP